MGLLPDLFDLREQIGAGPAINPGTVQAHLAELYGRGKIYDVKKLRNRGWFIHSPCAISDIREDKSGVTFIADGWGDKPYFVLISGVTKEPSDVGVRKVFQSATEPPPFKPAKKEFYGEPRPSDGLGKHKYLVIILEEKSEIRISIKWWGKPHPTGWRRNRRLESDNERHSNSLWKSAKPAGSSCKHCRKQLLLTCV